MKKRWIIVVMALILAAGTSFAGGQADTDAAAEEKPVTIVMRTQEHGQAATTEQEIVQMFMEKNPNIKVDLIQGQWTDHYTQLRLASMAGESPAVASTLLRKIVEMDQYYTPLDDSPVGNLLEMTGVEPDKFDESGWTSSQHKGHQFAVPNVYPAKLMWYNRDIFREVGLDPDRFPDNRAEFENAADKIKDAGYYAFHPAANGPPRFWRRAWYILFWSKGGELFDSDYTKPTFNNADGVSTLQYLVDMIHEKEWNVVGADGYKQFGARELGMIYAGNWFYPNAVSSGADYRGAQVPVFFEKRVTWINGNGFVIPKQASGTPKELYLAAMKMINFYAENSHLSTIGAGHVCAYKPAQTNPELLASDYWIKAGTYMAQMIADGAVHYPIRHPRGAELESAIETKVELAVNGQMSPEEALRLAEEECMEILK
ncbi:hypothetical protein ES707_22479 [subsurface metagenome]